MRIKGFVLCLLMVLGLAATAVAGVTMEVLPLLPGDTRAESTAISASGTIVGYSYDATTAYGDPRRAWAWSREDGIRELGGVGGDFAEARDVNDAGYVAGRARDAAGDLHAVLWEPDGTTVDLGIGEAYTINANNEVIGTTRVNSRQTAFFWSPITGMHLIEVAGAGFTYPTDVNDAGQVTGDCLLDGVQRAFAWSPVTGLTDLGDIVGVPSVAYAINNAGQVVGGSPQGAFLFDGGTVQYIGGGKAATAGYDINEAGEVAGFDNTDPNNQRALYWSTLTGSIDLGTLGGRYTSPVEINGGGAIVGWSETSRKKYHGFVWTPGGGMVDLTPENSVYSYASAVNDAGQVAGWTRQVVKKVTKYPPVLWTVTP